MVDGIKPDTLTKRVTTLFASATEGQMRLISAVMGGRTFKGREAEVKNCPNLGLPFLRNR